MSCSPSGLTSRSQISPLGAVAQPGGVRTVLRVGFAVTDIDECALPTGGHICSYRCINIPGSFQCSCPPTGYRLAPNGRNCQGEQGGSRGLPGRPVALQGGGD